jgi:anti-sigma factor RsiW
VTESEGNVSTDDILLTGYVDGELDAPTRAQLEARLKVEPALAARLARLSEGTRGLDTAFAALTTAAPRQRLAGVLDEARRGSRRAAPPRGLRIAVALAAAIVIFVLGGFAERYVSSRGVNDELNWRQAVAEYQQFTTSDTLAAIPDAPDVLDAELKTISARLAFPLTPDNLTLADATLKRADLFSFDGRPLVQLAYLTRNQGPIAFCIIPAHKPDAPVQFEVRNGFNLAYWNDDGRAYLLIGHADRTTLERFATTLAEKV